MLRVEVRVSPCSSKNPPRLLTVASSASSTAVASALASEASTGASLRAVPGNMASLVAL